MRHEFAGHGDLYEPDSESHRERLIRLKREELHGCQTSTEPPTGASPMAGLRAVPRPG